MTIHSTDGESWLARLRRINELSACDGNLVLNNLGHLVNIASLKECYQRLDGTTAVGMDGITKEAYGVHLEENLKTLLCKIRKGSYRPKPSRVVEIPKEDGSTRPLAISCFEDKIVQSCVRHILENIFEPLFLPCSFGFRPGRSAHDALRALCDATYSTRDGAIVEIDLQKYFNTIPHGELLAFLKRKISDTRFLALVETLLKAPSLERGNIVPSEIGSPQGSILSPILANVFLHYVVDEWFSAITASHFEGKAQIVRYADDLVFVFERRVHAERFFRVLPKRLAKYGLTLNLDKSQLLTCGSRAVERMTNQDEKVDTFRFLGFTCHWGRAYSGRFWRLKYKTRSDRMRATLGRAKVYLQENRHPKDIRLFLGRFVSRVRGWVNYHAISDNQRAVRGFLFACCRYLIQWFNRRGGRKRMTWARLNHLLKELNWPTRFKTVSMYPLKERKHPHSHGSVVR